MENKTKLYLLPYWPMFALRAMLIKAEHMGLKKGVAFVCVRHQREEVGTIHFLPVNRTFQRESYGPDDLGTNYFGVAMEKLAAMMGTGQPSGQYDGKLKRGESPYRGGLFKYDGRHIVYVGFSGGTEDQDVEIAETGMKMMFAEGEHLQR